MFGMPSSSKSQPLSQEDITTVIKIQMDCYNNMAASYIRLSNFTKAVEYAGKVLDKEPENVKALYRRGTSYHRLNELDKAEKDLRVAVSLAPLDKAIRQEYASISKTFAEYEQKNKERMAGMFQKR
jgi:Flp pilus assembly protein TadD